MIVTTLGESRKYAALQTDIARVAYVLIVANADKAGRVEADPLLIARKICVRLPYTFEDIELALQDMHRVGLITLYEANGIPILQITDFLKHNTPHYKEPESSLPGPEDGVQHETNQHQVNVEPTLSQRQANVESTFPLNRIKENEIKEKGREGEVEVQDAPPPKHSEDNFDNLLNGSPTANDTHRVRATIRRLNADFAKRNEHQMQAWSRWTNQQIHEMWDAADPRKWPNEHDKKRSWIFADLLNEERQPPPKPYKNTIIQDIIDNVDRELADIMGEQ